MDMALLISATIWWLSEVGRELEKRKQAFELTEEILAGAKPLLMLYKCILEQQPSEKEDNYFITYKQYQTH